MEDLYLYFLILISGFILILFGYLQLSDQNDKINNFLAFFSLSFVFINILVLLNLMFQISYLNTSIVPIYCYALVLPILVFGLIILISTILANLYRLVFKSKDYSERDEMKPTKRDTYRKITHVLIFIGLFIIWNIGYTMVINSKETWAGMIPTNNNTLEFYLNIFIEKDYLMFRLFDLGWFYFLIFFFFYVLCILLLCNELTRKLKYVSFPFNLFPNLIMTEEEKRSYGTYLYFSIGQLFAAFLCPPMVFFAILGMGGIGDLMTSQIGIRYGKHRIRWNNKKTWEGTITGTITCLILCFFFVGIIWAIIFATVFTIIDLVTNKPINASDNLLIPIACALVYVFLRYFFNLEYFTLIMQWF